MANTSLPDACHTHAQPSERHHDYGTDHDASSQDAPVPAQTLQQSPSDTSQPLLVPDIQTNSAAADACPDRSADEHEALLPHQLRRSTSLSAPVPQHMLSPASQQLGKHVDKTCVAPALGLGLPPATAPPPAPASQQPTACCDAAAEACCESCIDCCDCCATFFWLTTVRHRHSYPSPGCAACDSCTGCGGCGGHVHQSHLCGGCDHSHDCGDCGGCGDCGCCSADAGAHVVIAALVVGAVACVVVPVWWGVSWVLQGSHRGGSQRERESDAQEEIPACDVL